MVFLDESGFMLQPVLRRTWAPRGRTPILRQWDRRDRLSTISAITIAPRRRRFGLYWAQYPHNIRSAEVLRFLQGLGDICRTDSRSSGTADSHIGQSRSKHDLESVAGSCSSGCHRTLRNSIPWKCSGAIPSMGILRTMHQRAFSSLSMRSSTLCREPKARNHCFRPSSKTLGYNCDAFHYFGKSQ